MGELYEVDDAMLNVLDQLEQHPTWYIRTDIKCVLVDTDNVVDCQVYFLKDPKPILYSYPYFNCYDDSLV